ERERGARLDVWPPALLRAAEPGRSAAARAAEHRAEDVLEPRTAGLVLLVLRPGARSTAEHRAEDVLEPTGRAARARVEARAATGHRPHGVVLLALLGVREHRVGLADLLEPGLGGGVTGVLVRVVLAGQLAVCLLDGRLVG